MSRMRSQAASRATLFWASTPATYAEPVVILTGPAEKPSPGALEGTVTTGR